jgi:hypothetical protein
MLFRQFVTIRIKDNVQFCILKYLNLAYINWINDTSYIHIVT